jgi:hypothetical protein
VQVIVPQKTVIIFMVWAATLTRSFAQKDASVLPSQTQDSTDVSTVTSAIDSLHINQDDSISQLSGTFDNVRIMVMGNSITNGTGDGAATPLGYRKKLYDLLKNNHYQIDFVGKDGTPPYEGHFKGGMKIYDFYPPQLGGRGQMDVSVQCMSQPEYLPNIVAIHLGTNDLNSDRSAPVVPYIQDGVLTKTKTGQLATLINYLLKWNNGDFGTHLQKIIVSQLVPIIGRDEDVVRFNLEVSCMVNDFQNGLVTGRPEPVFLCDHFSPFLENPDYATDYMYDDLHPNTTGYSVMAQSYYKKMSCLLDGQMAWFSDVTWTTATAGLDAQFNFKGVAVADVTDDGREDIYLCRSGVTGTNAREVFYSSRDNRPFVEDAAGYSIQDPGASQAAVFVDIDNDGDYDLFNGNAGTANKLYENLNNQGFRDISTIANIGKLNRMTKAIAAFDCENDGDMDILAVNSTEKNEFYINRGNGIFDLQDRGLDDETQPDKNRQSVSAADFDNDGDVDLYITKRYLANKLFVNDGTGHFSDQAAAAGVDLVHKSNGAQWADMDNDGDVDLLVTVGSTSSDKNPLLHAYKNKGDGTFQDITLSVNIPVNGYSVITADFDNDGDLDIVTTQESSNGAFFRNDGNWHFTLIENTGAEIHAGDVRGAATLDFDNDGDVDFITTRVDVFNVFMRNNLDTHNNYLKFIVFGPNGNAGGFGTHIAIYQAGRLGDPDALLTYRQCSSTSCFISQSSPVIHAGLGVHATVDLMARFTNGVFVTMRNVPTDQTITLRPDLPQQIYGEPAILAYHSGDGQSKQVGQELDEPVVVKVMDDQNKPVAGADVAFHVTDGNAELFFREAISDALWIETEAGNLGGSSRRAYDPSSSGGGYIFVPNTSASAGFVDLQAEMLASNTYHVWLRYANSFTASSIETTIDNSISEKTTLPATLGWQWEKGSVSGFTLNKGQHTITLHLNSPNLQLDRILFTPDSHYTPSGLGEDAVISPQLTDRDGLARRFVRLGTTAGQIHIQSEFDHQGKPVNGSPILFAATALPGPAAILSPSSGDNQTGHIGAPLEQPLTVSVSDAFSNPVSGFPVHFEVISGGGILQPDGTIPTNAAGQALTVLTPGPSSTIQQVKAESIGLSGSPVIFSATIQGIADELKLLDGGQQTGIVMITLSKPIKIKVINQLGSPVPDYPVDFAVLSKGGRLTLPAQNNMTTILSADSLLQVLTTAQGTALVMWQLGPKSGAQQMRIEAGQLEGSPLLVEAAAVPGPAFSLENLAGDNQIGTAGQTLPLPFKIRVTDAVANPIENFTARFSVVSGNGTINGKNEINVLTDGNGIAEAFFSLGSAAGLHQARIYCQGLHPESYIFSATALPDQPHTLSYVSGTQQTAFVNAKLGQPFIVRVTDRFQNPIGGHSVQFEVKSEQGHFDGNRSALVLSSADGNASIYLTLGAIVGDAVYMVEASSVHDNAPLHGSPVVFTASAQSIPAVPKYIERVGNEPLSGTINSILQNECAVRVSDTDHQPVQNFAVTYSSASDSLFIVTAQPVLTDAEGMARVQVQLGTRPGHCKIKAIASGLTGSPVIFPILIQQDSFSLRQMAGDNQTGIAGHILTKWLEVKVLNQNDQGVPDRTVVFHPDDGNGRILPDSRIVTDALGIAKAQWQLGLDSGIQFVRISTEGAANVVQFTATANANNAPFISIPESLFVKENEMLSFIVLAIDVENDTIQLGAKDLPAGATFDSLYTHEFKWKPDFEQSGLYHPRFIARDHFGASREKTLQLTVRNTNRPPQILLEYCLPHEHRLGQLKKPNAISFMVIAQDLDRDPLRYLWLVNNQPVSTKDRFILQSQSFDTGSVEVMAMVYDMEDTVSTSWSLDIITSIDLSTLAGEYTPFIGNSLVWQSNICADVLGFYVSRSMRPDGPFHQINSLIPANPDGIYHFIDPDVETGNSYYYRLTDVQKGGNTTHPETIAVEVSSPKSYHLEQNYPNPFYSRSRIQFELPQSAHTRVSIYNLSGQLIKTIFERELKPGYHVYEWDGLDDHGIPAAAGVYFYVLECPEVRMSKKMIRF